VRQNSVYRERHGRLGKTVRRKCVNGVRSGGAKITKKYEKNEKNEGEGESVGV